MMSIIEDDEGFNLELNDEFIDKVVKPRVKSSNKTKKTTNIKRCPYTSDWVEVEYGETYKKVKRGEGY